RQPRGGGVILRREVEPVDARQRRREQRGLQCVRSRDLLLVQVRVVDGDRRPSTELQGRHEADRIKGRRTAEREYAERAATGDERDDGDVAALSGHRDGRRQPLGRARRPRDDGGAYLLVRLEQGLYGVDAVLASMRGGHTTRASTVVDD